MNNYIELFKYDIGISNIDNKPTLVLVLKNNLGKECFEGIIIDSKDPDYKIGQKFDNMSTNAFLFYDKKSELYKSIFIKKAKKFTKE